MSIAEIRSQLMEMVTGNREVVIPKEHREAYGAVIDLVNEGRVEIIDKSPMTVYVRAI